MDVSRRRVLIAGSVAMVGVAGGAAAQVPPSKLDIGTVEDGKVAFDNWRGDADPPADEPPQPLPEAERVGFAIVGMGRLSLEEIIPAFAQCRMSKLVALVSGTPDKAQAVAAQHGIADNAIYSYDDFDRIRDNPAIQAVYIVLPNSMHKDFTLRAAKAGKHVLCEKPMSTSSADASAMVEACEAAAVKLMVAYRCQYEEVNREAIRLYRSGDLGKPRLIEAVNLQAQGDPDQWRHKLVMAGGGALPDIGLYCLNGARAYTGEEPVEVYARLVQPKDDPRFAEVEETVVFTLTFPSGTVATCSTSYDAHQVKDMAARLEKGWLQIPNAFAYKGQQLKISRTEEGKQVVSQPQLQPKNQFALEIDHFAQCIKQDLKPHTPGEEGLQDHVVMEAIYESARTNKPVALKRYDSLDTFRGPPPKKS